MTDPAEPAVTATEQCLLARVQVVAEKVTLPVPPVCDHVIVPVGLWPVTQATQLMALVLPVATELGLQFARVSVLFRPTVIWKEPLEGALRASPA